jgi:3-isopropylmalate/(R)-2-methylmalate dehydratase small subunit
MEKFETFTGTVCAVDRANIDTDALIPKEYLRSIQRTGFGHALFSDWRYNADGTDNPNFILNQPKTQGASILVGRNNFGCGSSREHAVWAVAQQGFRVVIAPKEGDIPAFADIFRNNCAKNGVLTIQLSSEEVDFIFEQAAQDEPLEATINLEEQSVQVAGKTFHFEMDPAVKKKLLLGMDDISETLLQEAAIQAFEAQHNVQLGGK